MFDDKEFPIQNIRFESTLCVPVLCAFWECLGVFFFKNDRLNIKPVNKGMAFCGLN